MRQEELAFIKAISTLRLSPAFLKQMIMDLYRRKKSVVPAVSRSTAPGLEAGAPTTVKTA